MKKLRCRKGWVLAPSPDDGITNVPFFVKVRDKDIVWSDYDIPANIRNLIRDYKDPLIFNNKQIKTVIGDWNITFSQDSTYEATAKISIGRSGYFKIEDNRFNLLEGIINLPVKTKNDEYLSMQCTLNTDYEDLMSSSISVSMGLDNKFKTINKFNVRLVNNITGFIHSFDKNAEYQNSFVYITVKGKFVS